MLGELGELLAAVPADGGVDAYETAAVDNNALGKPTAATRRLTFQRLRELYGLDLRVPVFRILRRLWAVDAAGRPLLALLCALGRDPLLRCTAPAVLQLSPGGELVRGSFLTVIREAVGDRLNDAVLDKVARNAASSWCQSGHLTGRMRKIRKGVVPTPGSLSFALWMGTLEGLAGEALLDSRWARVLDRSGWGLLPVALQAKQLGLLHVRAGGGVVEIDVGRLDPVARPA
ncbi:MAG TPA: hypothetical protein VMT79_15340 [Candidatus Binatia bacterium]|nr:hypothetical protein [Candidatus Binatia bacterium]